MAFNRYPAVDEYNAFPTPVRVALASSTEITNAINTLIEAAAEGGVTMAEVIGLTAALGSKAPLGEDGKIPSNVLPVLPVVNVFVVDTQAEMLALQADQGDVAIRMDTEETFILSTNSPAELADWKRITTPVDGVLTVNGRGGPNISGLAEQASLDALAASVELWANKTSDIAAVDDANNIIYPTATAVKRYIQGLRSNDETLGGENPSATAIPTQAAIKNFVEDQKSTDSTLGGATPSETIIPTQSAVKAYVTSQKSNDATLGGATPSTTLSTTQAAAKGYVEAFAEAKTNKSTDAQLGGTSPSNVTFPTQSAVKSYVDSLVVTRTERTSNTVTTVAAITPDPNLYFEYAVTSLASGLTFYNTVAYPTGSVITISIRDDGTARSLAWGTAYSGMQYSLPLATVAGKALIMVFRYSASRARWELLLLSQEA